MANSRLMVWVRTRRALIVGGTLVAVLLLLVLMAVFVIPSRLVARDLPATGVLKPDQVVKATNDVRGTMLQGIFGLLFIGTAFFTYQQLKVSRDNRTTEQFTRAIEHLGSEQMDVRVGGIYALERIARASTEDQERRAVLEILSTYIREHARKDRGDAAGVQTCTPSWLKLWRRRKHSATPGAAQVSPLDADVHAGLLVLARRSKDAQDPPIILSGTDLSRAYLAAPRVSVARFNRVNLQESVLQVANLASADLRHADLWAADLRWSNLQGANIQEAYLYEAKLCHSNLSGADLRGANLKKADLTGASHEGIKLSGATADAETQWPTDLDPKVAGVRFVP